MPVCSRRLLARGVDVPMFHDGTFSRTQHTLPDPSLRIDEICEEHYRSV